MDAIGDTSKALYCDTDSIMYVHIDTRGVLQTGDFLGDLTNELPPDVKITKFFCAGPKFYLLIGENERTGKPYSTYKIKGLSINQGTEHVINEENIQKLVRGDIAELRAPFSVISRSRHTGRLINRQCDKLCRVTASKRRFSHPVEDGHSVPFGYTV